MKTDDVSLWIFFFFFFTKNVKITEGHENENASYL